MSVYFIQNLNEWVEYLFDLIPSGRHYYNMKNFDLMGMYYCKNNIFKYPSFSYTTAQWNKVDCSMDSCKSLNVFRIAILKTVCPTPSFYKICNPYELKLVRLLPYLILFSYIF